MSAVPLYIPVSDLRYGHCCTRATRAPTGRHGQDGQHAAPLPSPPPLGRGCCFQSTVPFSLPRATSTCARPVLTASPLTYATHKHTRKRRLRGWTLARTPATHWSLTRHAPAYHRHVQVLDFGPSLIVRPALIWLTVIAWPHHHHACLRPAVHLAYPIPV